MIKFEDAKSKRRTDGKKFLFREKLGQVFRGIRKEPVPRKERTLDYERIIMTVARLKPRYLNLGLLIAVLGISLFGVLMVYSASWYNATIYFNNRYHFFTSQLIGLILGMVGLGFAYHVDYRVYARFRWAILGGAIVLLLLVFVPGVGVTNLGATRWIGIGGFTMQPSEIAKFAFLIFAASRGDPWTTVASPGKSSPAGESDVALKHLSIRKLALVLGVGLLLCGLILLQPNLSIVMTLGMTMFICLFLFGARIKHLAILMIPVLIAVPVMLVAEPYRIARLVAFVDPWATPREEGFQLIQSLFGLGNGGLFGVGFLNSTQKYMFLPFSESDFIFSIIGEEFGLIGTAGFLIALGYVVFKIFGVGKRCRDPFGKFLAFGIGVLIFVQSAINIAVVTGSIPPTGLPLPFVSFGGTSLFVYLSAIGIVLNIDKRSRMLVN